MRRSKQTRKKPVNKAQTKIKQIAYNQAKKAINNTLEHKFFNNYESNTVGTTGNTNSKTDVLQETTNATDSVRVGDELHITSFSFRYVVVVGDAYNIVRVIFFQWLQDDAPTLGDIYADTANAVVSPYRRDTNRHYKILYDRTHALDTYNTVQVANKFLTRGFKKKMKFDAGTTTGQGKIYFSIVSDSSAVAHPTYRVETQLNYLDA